MGIKVNKGSSQEAVNFDEIWLNKFTLEQAVAPDSKITVKMRTFLAGQSDTGRWVYDKASRWDHDISDFEKYAIEMYCTQNECTLQEGAAVYISALQSVEEVNILEVMAYFQKGIGLIYDFEKDEQSEVR